MHQVKHDDVRHKMPEMIQRVVIVGGDTIIQILVNKEIFGRLIADDHHLGRDKLIEHSSHTPRSNDVTKTVAHRSTADEEGFGFACVHFDSDSGVKGAYWTILRLRR
jgi:hypothetical protein